MAFYTPTVGIITNISVMNDTAGNSNAGCTLFYTLQSEDQGTVNLLLPGNAYVLDGRQLQVGERATFFYSASAPAPAIYPPQYRAVAAAYTPQGTTAALDVFDSRFTNSDNTLVLNMPGRMALMLPNGQRFFGDPAGKLLLITYTATTRSIPAQTTPEQVVVFCSGS